MRMRKVAFLLWLLFCAVVQSNFAQAQNASCTVYTIAVGCYVWPQGLLLIPATMPDGSVTSPSLSFKSAPTTGLFRNATNPAELDFTANGTLATWMNAQGFTGNIGQQTPKLGAFTILQAVNEFRFPIWATTSRPNAPVVGETGYNTSFGQLEYWTGSAWLQLSATGNTIHGASALSWGTPVTVTAGTYIIMASWPWATGVVQSVTGLVGAGGMTFTVELQINGTDITGCSAIVINNPTATKTTCTANNVLVAGQMLTAIVSGVAGSPNMSAAQINYIHSEP